jgi:membrane-associated phospholipid phosphatase
VHFVTDIVVGSALGVLIGLAGGWAARAGMRRVSRAPG